MGLRELLFGQAAPRGRETWGGLGPRHARDVQPLEGTNSSLWGGLSFPSISDFWSDTFGPAGTYISPTMAEKVWVSNRCIQLNSQQIASMPLKFQSTAPGGGYEPAWVSNPDPNWYPNGVSDAIFSAVKNLYGYGYSIIYITSRYASGFPQTWTVLDSGLVSVELREGRRMYKINDDEINPFDIVQIDRDPGCGIKGTSAIRSYATQAWGLLAASELGRSVMQGGIPQVALKSERKLTKDQAEALQAQWVTRTSDRGGAPPILPPELSFQELSMSPADLLLLEGLEFNARAIASAYGVPPFLLNLPLTGGLTYQNPAMLGEMWWRFELRPTGKRIADAFTAQMLPRGSWVWLDAADTFEPIINETDDVQLSQVASASPSDQPQAQVRPIRATGG